MARGDGGRTLTTRKRAAPKTRNRPGRRSTRLRSSFCYHPHSGRGLVATANEEPYSLAAELLSPRPGRRRFLLEAKGDSMTGAGIEEGNLLVVEENPSPPDGSGVAALVLGEREEEATVKVLRRQSESIRLEARNEAHEDKVVLANRVTVQGTVEWVIKRVRGRR